MLHIARPSSPNPFRAPQTLAQAPPKIPVLELPAQVQAARLEVAAPLLTAPRILAPPPKQVQMGAFTPQLAIAPPPPALKAPAGAAAFDSISAAGGKTPMRQVSTGGAFDTVQTGSGTGSHVVSGNSFDAVAIGQPSSKIARGAGGGFGDVTIVQASTSPKISQPARTVFHPVEILQKPKPAYTDEARRLGVEGEVVLEALFTSAGQIRILRTIKGLGHGLDETALRAAEAIRFKPAERDGQPVDFTAAVHVLFQLAN